MQRTAVHCIAVCRLSYCVQRDVIDRVIMIGTNTGNGTIAHCTLRAQQCVGHRRAHHCTVVHCTVLYYVLHCTELYYVLHCSALDWWALHPAVVLCTLYTVLHCASQCKSVLYEGGGSWCPPSYVHVKFNEFEVDSFGQTFYMFFELYKCPFMMTECIWIRGGSLVDNSLPVVTLPTAKRHPLPTPSLHCHN